MNRILNFFDKQQGIAQQDFTYDFAMGRLCVPREDDFRGITPSTHSSDYNPEPPIFSAKFANCANYKHILAMANEDGKIALHNTIQKSYELSEKALEGEQCHYNAVFDLEWVPNRMAFVSASGDHTARLWEITDSGPKLCKIFTGHTRSVKTVAFRKNDQAVFASGGRDGAILIWDTRVTSNTSSILRADNCIYSGHAGGPGTPVSQRKRTTRTPKLCPNTVSSSITGLVFQDDKTLISCGAGDGIIKIWDLRRNYTSYKREPLPKHSLPYAGTSIFKGFTYLLCDEPGIRLYASCMDNTIYCYNLSSLSVTKPIQRYVGLRNSTFYIKSCLSPDGNYLISGSSDEKAYIWNLKNSQPLVTLNGHTVEVTCVAWSGANEMRIVTCSENARHKLWSFGPEKISDDERFNLRGNAEYCKEYMQSSIQQHNSYLMRNRLQELDRTPRSLRRIVEQNEKTPSSIEKMQTKRSFTDMTGDGYIDANGSEQKRHHMETRGRRLFSPSTSISSKIFINMNDNDQEPPQKQLKLSPFFNHTNDSNQENPNQPLISLTVNINNNNNNNNNDNIEKTPTLLSPLAERKNVNLKSPIKTNEITFSPTSNLPNYVMDGDAPHLGIMSPIRKHKEKIDWLTKMRKQKLMSKRSILMNDKLMIANDNVLTTIAAATTTTATATTLTKTNCDNDETNILSYSIQENNNNNNNFLSSPRLQNLRISDNQNLGDGGGGGCSTPKRRISHSGDFNSQNKKISSSPRPNETTILKFFTTISNEHRKNRHSEDSDTRTLSSHHPIDSTNNLVIPENIIGSSGTVTSVTGGS